MKFAIDLMKHERIRHLFSLLPILALCLFYSCSGGSRISSNGGGSDGGSEAETETCCKGNSGASSGEEGTEADTKTCCKNVKATLGMNMERVGYSSKAWVFVDIFKMSTPFTAKHVNGTDWSGTPLALDGDGWVTSLQPNQAAVSSMLLNLRKRFSVRSLYLSV